MENKFRKKIKDKNIDAVQRFYDDFKNTADKMDGYINTIEQRKIHKQNKVDLAIIKALIVQGHVQRVGRAVYTFKDPIIMTNEAIKICQLLYLWKTQNAAKSRKKKNKLTVKKQKIYKKTFWQKLINLFKK